MFVLIASLLFTLLAGLVLWLYLPAGSRKYLRLYWGLALLVHGLWVAARFGNGALWTSMPVGTVVVFWLVAVAILGVIGGGLLLGRGTVRWLLQRLGSRFWKIRESADGGERESVNRDRRALLSAAPAVGLSLVATSVAATGVASASQPFKVVHQEIPFKGLPSALDGFRIGQLSDVHVAGFISPRYLSDAVQALNAAQVDIQVMTGDLIDDVSQLEVTFGALQECRAQHGMVCILGNHEKRRGHLDPVMAMYQRYMSQGRLTLLVDQSMQIQHQGAALSIIGVDYPMRSGGNFMPAREKLFALMKTSADTAFAGIPADVPKLCLTHHPDFFHFSAARGAGLTLAGHTHGGQCQVAGRTPVGELFDYVLGRYQIGDAHLYVSPGTGHLVPFRIGVPTEVTVLTLRSV